MAAKISAKASRNSPSVLYLPEDIAILTHCSTPCAVAGAMDWFGRFFPVMSSNDAIILYIIIFHFKGTNENRCLYLFLVKKSMFYLQDKQNASINSYVLELILYLITKVLIKIGLQELFSVFFSIYLTILSVGHKHGSFFCECCGIQNKQVFPMSYYSERLYCF